MNSADPLHHFLKAVVAGDARDDLGPVEPIFHAHALVPGSGVVLFTEGRTGRRLVGKFYSRKPVSGSPSDAQALRAEFMMREFKNLRMVRRLGFDKPPFEVVRPLGCCAELGYLVLQTFVSGRSLQAAIEQAALTRESGDLPRQLQTTARFLATLHDRTAMTSSSQQGDPAQRILRTGEQLAGAGLLTRSQMSRLAELARAWIASGQLGSTEPVLIHGDATPPHFVFDHSPDAVTAIDLERLWPGDRALDLGCMAAEIKHLFWRFADDPWASEPFIRGFYAAYRNSTARNDENLTERGRFYQGLQQLRIGRNEWLPLPLRRALVDDGLRCIEEPNEG